MTDDTKVLRLVPKASRAPPQEALEMLRDVMARLEKGEIADIAIAAAGRDDELHTCWFGWSGRLIAPAQLLAARLMTDLRGQ